ncbi:GNAT family N-acetyltransferase [Shigella flexneri]
MGHLTIWCNSAHAAVMLPNLVCVDSRWKNRSIASALMREMIEMCDNWLRVDRIELTVFVDNTAIKVYKKYGFEIEGTGKITHCVMVDISMRVIMARVK